VHVSVLVYLRGLGEEEIGVQMVDCNHNNKQNKT
jgi:hypothetical protein